MYLLHACENNINQTIDMIGPALTKYIVQTITELTYYSCNITNTHPFRAYSRPHGSSVSLGFVTWVYRARIQIIFEIVVVHIQCSKLFEGMECTVLPMVHVHYKKPLKSFEIGVGRSPGFGFLSIVILP